MASSPENPSKGFDELLSAQQRDDLISAGLALEMIQNAEGVLGTVIGVVFHSSDTISLASLESEEEAARRQTLGQLIRELRKRAEVHSSVEEVLEKFLTRRNEFVHHLSEVRKTRGDDAARLLTTQVIANAYAVVRFLGAVLMVWKDQMEIQVDMSDLPLSPDIEAMILKVPYLIGHKP